MESLNIRTGIKDFLLIDSICHVDGERIHAEKDFEASPVFSAMEALAQTAAFHVRREIEFSRHAFLLKIRSFRSDKSGPVKGRHDIFGRIASRSEKAFSCIVTAEKNGLTRFSGDLVIATIPYDDNFKESVLKPHYQKVFSCLQRASDKG